MRRNNNFHTVRQRIPYSTTSIDYQNIFSISKNADDFEKIINKKISQFEKQGINISACSEYFENMVDEYVAKLLSQLESQHASNMRMIGYFFRKRAADKIEFQELINRLEIAIASTEAEYELVEKLATELNPLKNGRLVAEQRKTVQEEDELNA